MEQETAEKMMEELMAYAATFKREKVNAKELIIGMKCGGSDGLSGITANPTVGLFSDMLVQRVVQPFLQKFRKCSVQKRFL